MLTRICRTQLQVLWAWSIAALVLLAGCGGLPSTNRGGMTLAFSVKPASFAEQTLSVTLRIDRFPDATTPLRLYKGSVALSNLRCVDARNRDVTLRDDGGIIDLESLRGAQPATVTYTATVGGSGRHGLRGGLYPTLTVFDGETVLILPEVTVNGSDSAIGYQIARIIVEVDHPSEWTARVPYAAPASTNGRSLTAVERPTFFAVSQLIKSSFVFGQFISRPIRGSTASAEALVDPLVMPVMTDTVMQGLTVLCDYYANLFGSQPPNYALIFLRPDSGDGVHVMGGVGMSSVASTFDPDSKRDWELLSHRLFHSFFDAKMPLTLFRKKPQLWLYEGLATYYENVALESLPQSLREKLSVNVGEGFRALARRYAYLRVRDSRLAVAPMSEAKVTSSGAVEFLHYTQAPLIVKLLEDQGCSRFGGRDRILGFVVSNAATLKSIESVVSFGVVENHDEFLRKYLFGSDILPVWRLGSAEEDTAAVGRQLAAYELSVDAWFREDGSQSSDTDTSVTDSSVVASMDSIRSFSPTVFRMLSMDTKRLGNH